MAEMDRLEIAIEAEASNANRALHGMEKRLDKIADKLEKVIMLANGKFNFDGAFAKSLGGRNTSKAIHDLGRQWADELIDGFNLDKAGKDVTGQVRNLTDTLASEFGKGRSGDTNKWVTAIEDLGRVVAKNATRLDDSVKSYEDFYEYIKSRGKIKIAPEDASSLGDFWKERAGILKQKMNTKSGIELDDIYQEAFSKFPSVLPEPSSVENEFHAIDKAMRKYYELRDNSLVHSSDIEDSAYDAIVEGTSELNNAIQKIKENEGKVNDIIGSFKSLQDVLNFDTSSLETVDECLDSIYNSFNKISKVGPSVRKAGQALEATKQSAFQDMPEIPIHRWTDEMPDYDVEDAPQDVGDFKVDKETFRSISEMGRKATATMYDYESVIKRLKGELKELASMGKIEGDADYDHKARQLARATAEQKKYNKELRKTAEVEAGLKEMPSKLSMIANRFKSLSGFASRLGKGMKKTGSVIAKVGKAFLGMQKKVNKGMSMKRMVGMSILFSAVFQGISAIQRAIVEGSNNLVQYSAEYNHSISSIVSALTFLKNAWAAAFAPIVNVVAPYLQAFVNMVASALNAIGRFMAALTGKGFAVQAKKVWKDYGAGLDKAGGSAGGANKKLKELKKTILGFDELNVLNAPDTDNGGGGGGGGGGATELSPEDMFTTVTTDGAVADFAKRLREAFLNEDWEGLGNILADGVNIGLNKLYAVLSWDNVGQKVEPFIFAFTTTLNSLVDGVDWDRMGRVVGAGVNTVVNAINLFKDGIDWKNIGTRLSNGINGLIDEVEWENVGHLIGNKFRVAIDVFAGLVKDLKWDKIGESIACALNETIDTISAEDLLVGIGDLINGITEAMSQFVINTDWSKLGSDIGTGLSNAIANLDAGKITDGIASFVHMFAETISSFVGTFDWTVFGEKLVDMLCSIDWLGLLTDLGNIVGSVIGSVIAIPLSLIGGIGAKIKEELIDPIGSNMSEAWDSIKDKWNNVGDWFGKKFSSARKNTEEKFNDIGDWFGKRKEDIKNNQEEVDAWFSEKYKNARESVDGAFKDVGSWFSDRYNDITSAMDGTNTWFSEKFQSAYGSVQGAFKDVGSWFSEKYANIKSSFSDIKNDFLDIFSSAYDGMKEAFADLPSFFGEIPGKILEALGDMYTMGKNAISNFISGFQSLKIPTPHFKRTGSFKVAGFDTKIPTFGVSWYAKGGFPSVGEMFVAREKGPELVGRMGSKNAVANNGQIVAGIEHGVERAMMNVLMATGGLGGGNQTVNVYAELRTEDDEVLARAVARGNEKMGYRFEPSPAY